MLRAIFVLNPKNGFSSAAISSSSSGFNSNFSTTTFSPCSLRQTHYEVLGLTRTASSKEIKDAYLRLSKELHPDLNPSSRKSSSSTAVDPRYLAVSQAYEVLSKPRERNIYDLGLHGQEKEKRDEANDNGPHFHSASSRPMTFEERAHHMGFPRVDPDYYQKHNRHRYQIAAGCVVFIFFGFAVHFSIAKMMYEKHSREMSRVTNELNAIAESRRENARRFSTVKEQWEEMKGRKKEE